MKRYLGIGTNRVTLFCEHIRTDKDGIWFDVINGAWEGCLKDGVIYTQRGPAKYNVEMKVLFNDTIPVQYCKDYNEAIEYINDLIGRGQTYLTVRAIINRIKYKCNPDRFVRRIKDAIIGMKQGWNGTLRKPNSMYPDMDDDIPF